MRVQSSEIYRYDPQAGANGGRLDPGPGSCRKADLAGAEKGTLTLLRCAPLSFGAKLFRPSSVSQIMGLAIRGFRIDC
jgi:hypothetical protein